MRVLELTVHYSPNVGGVETHLLDLVRELSDRNNQIFVLSYQPLTTRAEWKILENKKNIEILRIPWIPGLFYKFVKYPLLEFIYLFSGLFIITPFIVLLKSPKVVHAHGLVAGAIGVFWAKMFRKKVIVATHSIYNFPKTGIYRRFARLIFDQADVVMALSKKAIDEILNLGISKNKVKLFTYWVDLEKFSKVADAKRKLNWGNKFIVLFVGRLIKGKGLRELIKAADLWRRNMNLAIIGTGPLEMEVRQASNTNQNIEYLGIIDQERLPLYYSASDLLIVPSIHEEGFGRVILESLACGTPVVGADIGSIPEAMNETVGRLIKITPENIAKTITYLYHNKKILKKISNNARIFAEKRYSKKNSEVIIENLK